MKTLATAVAVAVLLVTGAGCSSETGEPAAKSMATGSSTPGPKATESATPPAGQYGVHCVAVAADMAQRIVSRAKEGIDVVAGRAMAVKARAFKNLYFVSIQFNVSGDPHLGVWVISKSVKLGEQGRIMAVDGPAHQFTTWPDAGESSADISKDPNVGDVKACQLI